jgi:hypothetical protein
MVQGEVRMPPLHRPHVATLVPLAAVLTACLGVAAAEGVDAGAAFFTSRVEPILRERCYGCHAHDTEISGGLALDVRSGWEQGGQAGPAVVPGDPQASLLITAVRHGIDGQTMPPDDPLPDAEIETLVEWVRRGAPDPRRTTAGEAWEKVYRSRLDWWSLQPVRSTPAPEVRDARWPRSPVDRFILARLEEAGLRPTAEASRRQLVRRLSFALTGLPPAAAEIEAFLRDDAADAYERLVDRFLASPHFGEHWARHWMDVVHYADTHGYEWDIPAKHAWRYRDYLVRAFNADVPYDRLVVEQIAGDLAEPRLDPASGSNDAVVGTMALRMGERWHGDNAAAEATTAQNIGDSVDTATKAFLATTVGCARCHDHKLDAIAQADYYALYGTLASSRWGVSGIDSADPNAAVIEELRRIKAAIRDRLAARWLDDRAGLVARLEAVPRGAEPVPAPVLGFPESLAELLRRPAQQPITAEAFAAERDRRIAANAANLTLLADFTRADATDDDAANGWRWEGFGMRHGLVADGEPVIADTGDAVLAHLLPAGRWSHVYSARLGGVVRSPELARNPPLHFSVGYAGGLKASHCLIVDRAFHSERVKYADMPFAGWLRLTAGNFTRLAGPPDTLPRRVYLELATKAYDNYFPPRTGYPGFKKQDEHDPRSWFGVTKVYAHAPDQGPLDELGRLEPLFAKPTAGMLPDRIADQTLAAVRRWADGRAGAADVGVINESVREGWLDNRALTDHVLAALVTDYRAAERRLEPERTIGGLQDWAEAADAPLALRGDPARPGEQVPRGTIRFLESFATRPTGRSSGRLEVARSIADSRNPLTARVFVNRVWLHLFGEGLVRTPDDFGHLGERPTHPELLDFLAIRFVEEGWSLKKLVRMLVTTAAWRQSSAAAAEAVAADPENRLWHHVPRRRLEAESIRDAMLAISGRLDPTIGGEPVDPYRVKEDSAKRLFSGPLDGRGRRSLYLRMTLMEPPRFLALFNQPSPQGTTGRRDRSTVPEQALALLNDPFVHDMARAWAARRLAAKDGSLQAGIASMVEEGLGRPATDAEVERLAAVAEACAAARGVPPQERSRAEAVWKDVAHAILILPEFSHVE